MGVFKEFYLNSYLVGEGLSGFIPSLAALAQGVGGNPYCDNVTYVDGNDTLIVSRLSSWMPFSMIFSSFSLTLEKLVLLT